MSERDHDAAYVRKTHRPQPVGQSLFTNSNTESDENTKLRLKGLEIELENLHSHNVKVELDLEHAQSKWRREEAKLLQDCRRSAHEVEMRDQEISNLKQQLSSCTVLSDRTSDYPDTQHKQLTTRIEHLQEEIKKRDKEISELRYRLGERSDDTDLDNDAGYFLLQGTPHLNFNLTDESGDGNTTFTSPKILSEAPQKPSLSSQTEAKTTQFLLTVVAPKIKIYKRKLEELNDKLKNEKEVIKALVTELYTLKYKGEADYENSQRRAVTGSFDSPSGGAHPSNFTLSFVSDDRLAGPRSHGPRTAPGYRYGSTLQQRSDGRASPSSPAHGSAEHVYTNTKFKNDGGASMFTTSESGTIKRAPVPVPRRTLKSMGSMSVSALLNSEELPDSTTSSSINSSIVHNYEIVDKSSIPSTQPQDASSAHPRETVYNRPTMLSQNITLAPTLPAATSHQPVSDIHARQVSPVGFETHRDSRVCGVCQKDFPSYTQSDFLKHCLDCVEDLADDGLSDPLPQPVITSHKTITTESRICPMCHQQFSEELAQEDFENHVHGHFPRESTESN